MYEAVFGSKGSARPKPERKVLNGQPRTDPIADAQVVSRARDAKSGEKFGALFDEGDWSGQGYPSQSEADLALCSFLSHARADAEAIDRVFRSSSLYRKKWDERHYSDGSTYGEATIALALKAVCENEEEAESDPYHPNNAGRRMVKMFGSDLLFCNGAWYCYDGKRWQLDNDLQVQRFARKVIETYKDEHERLQSQMAELRAGLEEVKDADERSKLESKLDWLGKLSGTCWGFYIRMSRPSGISSVAEAASWDRTVQLPKLDANPYLLNGQNGTLDLRRGELLPHRRSDLITKITPGGFDPDATSDLWDRFLDDAIGEDHATRSYMQRALGSALVGLQLEDLIIMLIGPGGTGKTTLLESCRTAIGEYGKPVPFEVFLERKHSGGTTPELASLPGVRMVTSAEPKENVGWDVARLKMLTGGDSIMVNPKYLKPFEFDPVFTLVLATNYAPKASGTDSALWRRLKIIRFDNVVRNPNKKLRLQLAGKLHGAEADPRHQAAVLAWLVEGCRGYLAEGLGEPPLGVTASITATRTEMDPLWAFLEAGCEMDPEACTASGALRDAYQAYASEIGASLVDDATWGTMLTTFGATPVRRMLDGRLRRAWAGIRLRDTAHDTVADRAVSAEDRAREAREGDSAGS